MGTTTRGLRYPEPTDRVNQGHVAIANLAADVQSEFDDTLGAGSGTRVTLSAAGKTAAGVTVVSFGIVRLGPFRHLVLHFTWTGATLTSASTGNLTDTPILTAGALPAGDYRASGDLYVYGTVPGVSGATFRLETNGAISLTDLSGSPAQAITSGTGLRLDATYSPV